MVPSLFITLTVLTVEDLRQRKLMKSLGHSTMLMGRMDEMDGYKMQD